MDGHDDRTEKAHAGWPFEYEKLARPREAGLACWPRQQGFKGEKKNSRVCVVGVGWMVAENR